MLQRGRIVFRQLALKHIQQIGLIQEWKEFDLLSLAFVAFTISHAGGRLQVITGCGTQEGDHDLFF